MIIKDMDSKKLNNKYLKSGFEAEKQMSFYLKRAFGDNDYIYIINDLRLKLEDDYAQIDHLIIHRFGFIIVESKSVSTKVCVNEHGEWKRIFNDKESGMASPIQQAKRQGEFLRKFLMTKDNSELYRDNVVNKYLPHAIDKFAYDVLVAISDSGIIERDKVELAEICKADSITERVTDIISKYNKEFSKILTLSMICQFHKESVEKLSKLLLESHCPLEINKEKIIVTKEILQENKKISKNIDSKSLLNKSRTFDKDEIYLCKHCKSPNLEIKDGQYSYYFKCLFCHKNTILKLICTHSTELCKPILEKRGLKFFRVCKICKEDKLFFTNMPIKNEKPISEKEIPKSSYHLSCNKCNSNNIEILYGKYGYYIKCHDCNGTSKIILSCNQSSCKPKLKKEKKDFFKVCVDCNIKELFFTNK